MNAPLRITPGEARGLEILDMILRGRQVRLAAEVPTELRSEVVEVGAERILLTCMRILVTEGGRREQTLLRDGRRVRGRIWDPGVLDELKLEFTSATYGLWMGLCAHLDVFSRGGLESGGGALKTAARQVRKVVRTRNTAAGDWLVYALLIRNLNKIGISAEIRREFHRRLAVGSPLARLLVLFDPDTDTAESTADRLDPLFAPTSSPLCTCLTDLIAESWIAVVKHLWRNTNPGTFRVRCAMADRMLRGYLLVLQRHRRLDLASPLLRLADAIVHEIIPGSPDVERQRTLSLRPPESMAERDSTLRAASRLLDFSPQLTDLHRTLSHARYGDPDYEQAQVFLQMAPTDVEADMHHLEALRLGLGGALR